MVLGGRPPGRVGRRRISQYEAPPLVGFCRNGEADPPGRFVAFGLVPLRSGAWPLGWKTTKKGRKGRTRRPDRGDRGHRVARRGVVRSRRAVRLGEPRGAAWIGAARDVPRGTTAAAAEIVIGARRTATATGADPRATAAAGAARIGEDRRARRGPIAGVPRPSPSPSPRPGSGRTARRARSAPVLAKTRHRDRRRRDGRPRFASSATPASERPRKPARPPRDERRPRPAAASAARPPTSRPRSSGSVAGGARSCWNA
jgi:hypothetical protein